MESGEDVRLTPLDGGSVSGVADPQGDLAPSDAEERAAARSLLNDIETLVEDGKTYLEAEAHFQKSRAIFVLDGAQVGGDLRFDRRGVRFHRPDRR